MKILFTGGGSAGHVIPNIALINELLKEGYDICYMGTNGIEKEIIKPIKIPYYTITCPKYVRSFSIKNLKIPFAFIRAKREAMIGLKTFAPNLVFSKGGYVSLPTVFAANALNIPIITHESDLSIGLANKLMVKKCNYIFTSFPETADKFKNGKYTGSPLRKELFGIEKNEALKKYKFDGKRKVLLIFGGGSGSVIINNAIRKNIKELSLEYDILHICGKDNTLYTNVRGYRQLEFEREMGYAYAASDLVISRAGSNTIFEILALKKSSLLIPLENQSRGDQLDNAEYFQNKNLVHILKQSEIEFLPSTIKEAINDKEMQKNIAVSNFSNGTSNTIREIKKFLSERKK